MGAGLLHCGIWDLVETSAVLQAFFPCTLAMESSRRGDTEGANEYPNHPEASIEEIFIMTSSDDIRMMDEAMLCACDCLPGLTFGPGQDRALRRSSLRPFADTQIRTA